MLIAQVTDMHIKVPGSFAYRRVDTAAMLGACVTTLGSLEPKPDLIVLTGDLVDLGRAEEYDHLKSILAPLDQRIIAIPGNHDDRDAMRTAFAAGGYLPATGDFLNFALDDHPLRIVGLDTLVPGEGRGELCRTRLEWLDATLTAKPETPTVVLMHHPPFRTGIGHMDRIGLTGHESFAEIMARHKQVQRILCGHLHRPIQAMVGGRLALTCPSPAHQVSLKIAEQAPSCFHMEPPAFMLHWWNGETLVTHTVPIGAFDGPYPFFGADGRLID